MKRRRCLALAGTLLSASLAGCSEDDDPVDEDGMKSAYREELLDRGIEIDHLGVGGDRLIMDYSTTTTTEDELLQEMAHPVFGYAEIVTPGWEVNLAEVWINDPDVDDPTEQAMASYLVRNEWAFEWQENGITDDELMGHVLDSIEVYEPFENRYGGTES